MITVGVGYDVLSVLFGWPTISQGVRDLDQESGQLVRWLWLALWFHFFVLCPDASKYWTGK